MSNQPKILRFIVPMAAQSVSKLPEGDDWLYELKLDGYRALLIKDGGHVEIRSRNDKDLTRMYPRVAAAAAQLEAEQAVIDGEIVALGPEGRDGYATRHFSGSGTTKPPRTCAARHNRVGMRVRKC